MTNTVKIIVLSVSFFLLAASVYAIVSIHETIKMEKDGRMLMQHIEVFCAEHGRLPDHSELLDCENDHNVGPFYEKTSDVTYSLEQTTEYLISILKYMGSKHIIMV